MKGKPRHADGNGGNGRSNGNGDRARAARTPTARPHEVGGKRMWLYGIHPVLAALANPRRRALRVLLTAEAEESLGPRLEVLAQSHPNGLPKPEVLSRDTIER